MANPTRRRLSTPLIVASVLVLVAALALGGSGLDQSLASAAPATPAVAAKTATPAATASPTTPSAAVKTASPSATGKIAVFKFMCNTIGPNHTCNGRDTSLDGYVVNFQVFAGGSASGPVLETIPVTLGLNDQSQGHTGDGSQGRNTGALNYTAVSPNNVFTVCEVPVAIKGSLRVDLNPQARPPAGNGGSTGGTNQTLLNNMCIVVKLTPGTAELQFLDTKVQPTPTPTATTTPSATATATPTGTLTATATPTATAVSSETPVSSTPTPTATPTNTPAGNTPTATPTNTPGAGGSTPTPTATNTPKPGGGSNATPVPTTSGGGSTPTPAPTTAGVTSQPTSTPPAVVLAETPAPVPPAPATPAPQVLAATPPVTVLPAAGAGGLPLTELPLGLMLADALGLLGAALLAASRWRIR